MEECVQMERKCLLEYLQNSKEKLLKAMTKEQVINCGTGKKDKNEIQRKHITHIEETPLYGRF